MILSMKNVFFVSLFFTISLLAQVNKNLAVNVAETIANRIIQDTSFKLDTVKQREAVDVQVIDFNNVLPELNKSNEYAFALIKCNKDEKLNFGLSFSEPFSIYLNKKRVYKNTKKTKFHFNEIAYSIFVFNDSLIFNLHKGINEVYIISNGDNHALIYLREITASDQPTKSSFVPINSNYKNYTWPWVYVSSKNLTEDEIGNIFSDKNLTNMKVIYPVQNKIEKLNIPDWAVFKKASYLEWNYANGETMMSLCTLAKETSQKKYIEFVRRYCDFTIEHMPLFRKQFYVENDLRGTDYRIFRKGMLDDVGGPVLPYVELTLLDNNNTFSSSPYDSLIQVMADYVMNRQFRLPDGTLCRPEPRRWTVWSDDQFMSIPFLVRMGKLTSQDKYYNEALKQIINFHKYLFVPSEGLYKHGWFSWTGKRSAVYWGRANGWAAWAISEALKYIPANISGYNKVKKLFLNYLYGLIKVQDKDGMWHQVLNDPSSYEETSCTAMFTIALSRAIQHGWLNKKYSANVQKAWTALTKRISGGIVEGICGGTGMGSTAKFYEERKTYKNDPRGLGAVITAAVEVQKLYDLGY